MYQQQERGQNLMEEQRWTLGEMEVSHNCKQNLLEKEEAVFEKLRQATNTLQSLRYKKINEIAYTIVYIFRN